MTTLFLIDFPASYVDKRTIRARLNAEFHKQLRLHEGRQLRIEVTSAATIRPGAFFAVRLRDDQTPRAWRPLCEIILTIMEWQQKIYVQADCEREVDDLTRLLADLLHRFLLARTEWRPLPLAPMEPNKPPPSTVPNKPPLTKIEQTWLDHIKAAEQSGNISGYRRDHSLLSSTYYDWRKRLKTAGHL